MPIPVKFNYDEQILTQAKKEAADIGLRPNSIRAGEGNLVGRIGEIIAANYLNSKREDLSNVDYDIEYRHRSLDLLHIPLQDRNVLRIDVKTKDTTVNYVRMDYEASVCQINPRQKCDIYLFTRVHLATNSCWLIGWISKSEFLELQNQLDFQCKNFIQTRLSPQIPYLETEIQNILKQPCKMRLLFKGHVDGTNNFIVKANCYNLIHENLYPLWALRSPSKWHEKIQEIQQRMSQGVKIPPMPTFSTLKKTSEPKVLKKLSDFF